MCNRPIPSSKNSHFSCENELYLHENRISISYQKPHFETQALGLLLNSLIHVIHEETNGNGIGFCEGLSLHK